ncbi:MAG: sulfite exporter TauE/SafE family protein [Peptococcaceae bacterium]|nr:sulfite exporter TauE/SafE family protein [Peptococcaceae bacterium]
MLIAGSFFLICFAASIIGAICGIGGGIIIKPALDTFGILDVAAISFLASCTVLAMTTYSVLRNKLKGTSNVNIIESMPLILGSIAGGIGGKALFNALAGYIGNLQLVGVVQAACLMIVTFGTLIFTVYKSRIPSLQIRSAMANILIGLALGLISSFLGIGGGPMNLVVLFFFFSMPTKIAVENSLTIIFFSQLANLLISFATGSIPAFPFPVLILMIAGGITGGIVGRSINKRISEQTVDKLFIALMAFIIVLNGYNIYQFML